MSSLEAELVKPLLEVLRDVSLDPAERAAFTADPADYLAQHGYEDVPPEDLGEAFGLMHDTLPAETAQALAHDPVYQVATTGEEALHAETAAEVGDIAPFGEVNGDFDSAMLHGDDDADLDDDTDGDDDLGDAPEDDRDGDDDRGDDDVELGAGFDADSDSVAFGIGSSDDGGDDDPTVLVEDPGGPGDLDDRDETFDTEAFGADVFSGLDDLDNDDLDTGAFGRHDSADDALDVDADDGVDDDADGIDDIGLF